MASPSVTHTFVNGTASDATQVNTNFTDLVNGASDGSKDYSINALTLAGLLTANGSVVLGSDSVDTITHLGTLTLKDTLATVINTTTATKVAAFSLSGATAVTTTTLTFVQTANRAITFPDATTTLLGTDATQTVSGKTFSQDLIANADDTRNIGSTSVGWKNGYYTRLVRIQKSHSGATVDLQVDNTSNVAGSEARLFAQVGGTSAGDPRVHFAVSGATDVNLGIDNSDSDAFVASRSGTLGTSNFMRVPADLIVEFPAGLQTLVSTGNVNDTIPSSAEAVTAFGAAATTGAGFIALINDAAGDVNNYLVFSNGTSYYALKFTKLT